MRGASKAGIARWNEIHLITVKACENLGILKGAGLAVSLSLIRTACRVVIFMAGVTDKTATKHVENYVWNLPAPKQGGAEERE